MELKKEMETLSDLGWPSRSFSCTKKRPSKHFGPPKHFVFFWISSWRGCMPVRADLRLWLKRLSQHINVGTEFRGGLIAMKKENSMWGKYCSLPPFFGSQTAGPQQDNSACTTKWLTQGMWTERCCCQARAWEPEEPEAKNTAQRLLQALLDWWGPHTSTSHRLMCH